ncbi:unnamed protein product, partial [Symbiodinium sp. KB8]
MAATASAGGKAPLPIKVLYMHGLESTAWGAKSDRLKHVVAEAEAVQMPVKHLRALSGPNPHVKAALACALVGVLAIAGGLLLLLHSDEVWEAGLNWRQQLAVALLFAGGLSLAATLLFVQWALQFLVEACYAVQRAALRRFKPDVVMGSSFGGGMAQLLLARGEWAGPTVLLAPAGEQVASYYDLLASIMTCWVCGCGRRCRGHSEQGDCHPMLHLPPEVPPAAQLPSGGAESSAGGASPGVPVLIVHSPVDTVVPFRDSLEWVAGRPDWMQCQVLPVPQDGHDLRKVALKVNMRKWLQGVWQAWRADEELSVDSDMKLGKPRSPARMKSAPFHVKFTHSSAVVQQKVLASSAWAHFPCRGSDQFPRSMPGSKSRSHAKQLEALKKSDPEFLAFLQQNDPALLDFAGDADSDSDSGSAGGEEHTTGTGAGADDEEAAFEDDDSSSDDEPERVLGATIPKPGEGSDDDVEEGGDDASEGASGTLLDAAKLAELTDSAFAQRHLRGLQYMLHAFRAAVHQQDEAPPATLRFRITSDLVFSKVLAVVLTNARGAFAHHLQGAVASVGPFNASQLTRSKRFRKVSPLLQSFLANLAHLLGQTLDASLLLLVLRSLKLYLPFFGAFPKLAARVTKALLRLYSREYPPAVHMEGEASHLAVAGVPLASAAASKG